MPLLAPVPLWVPEPCVPAAAPPCPDEELVPPMDDEEPAAPAVLPAPPPMPPEPEALPPMPAPVPPPDWAIAGPNIKAPDAHSAARSCLLTMRESP